MNPLNSKNRSEGKDAKKERTTKRRGNQLHPVFSLALEGGRDFELDQKDALLLRRISETSSLTEGAKLAGISYRNAWDRIRAIEAGLGLRLVETRVGGSSGGSARLTVDGERLLQEFRRVRKYLFNALEDRDFMSHVGYKISARNKFKAKVTKVDKGPITASVKLSVEEPTTVTAIISKEAVEDLDLKPGDEVDAIVKSTEVIIAKKM